MNLEEAKANIGKEVVLDESTKPYRCDAGLYLEKQNYFYEGNDLFISEVDKDTVSVSIKNKNHRQIGVASFYAKHLKLKEQPMQNYKIKVTPETSREVQELFFELGYSWYSKQNYPKHLKYSFIYIKDSIIHVTDEEELFIELDAENITLPQLRDLVVLKRGKTEMTWQDALRALADGKEIEFLYDGEWGVISDLFKNHKFRLAPQRKELNGKFTKEELLKIAEEME